MAGFGAPLVLGSFGIGSSSHIPEFSPYSSYELLAIQPFLQIESGIIVCVSEVQQNLGNALRQTTLTLSAAPEVTSR